MRWSSWSRGPLIFVGTWSCVVPWSPSVWSPWSPSVWSPGLVITVCMGPRGLVVPVSVVPWSRGPRLCGPRGRLRLAVMCAVLVSLCADVVLHRCAVRRLTCLGDEHDVTAVTGVTVTCPGVQVSTSSSPLLSSCSPVTVTVTVTAQSQPSHSHAVESRQLTAQQPSALRCKYRFTVP